MLCWAFKADFTNCNRRTNEESSFHDMPTERPRNEPKTVTHVYAHSVTQVRAPCREISTKPCFAHRTHEPRIQVVKKSHSPQGAAAQLLTTCDHRQVHGEGARG